MTTPIHDFTPYQLDDRYAQTRGRVFLTGTQALVRIMLDQARRDQAAGMNTAGFVSGYRGSPLGGLDQELWRNGKRLNAARIKFMPAIGFSMLTLLFSALVRLTLAAAASASGSGTAGQQ